MTASRATGRLATTVGANIKAAREAMGLTQRQLADLVNGVDSMAVSRWERGMHRPTDDNLFALADVLDQDPGWFYAEHHRAAAIG